MTIALFSSEYYPDNFEILTSCFSQFSYKPQITFIPSFYYNSYVDFRYFTSCYKKLGINKFIHFPIGPKYSTLLENKAFESDIIHLAGGNTFYFLYQLKKKRLINKLKDFYKNGGHIHGVSAGAIILSQTIDMASLPDFDRDENEINLNDWSGLKINDFHFFPHFKNSKRYTDPLLKFSKEKKTKVFAATDGSGILKNGQNLESYGRIFQIKSGKKSRFNGSDLT